eukprot:CAMPEP_0198513970 /NCGR_PEP_ID=MMETSP1462-20131121/16398_1 /TAXON_ID=1333877 /ORGANISM="Brandtodinium nutriculum, Strain RCC3387" /LENGTH=48 /DNA_ID= /DNA_START= /DNA_END= /DNA_ORIENTATION=
MYEGVLVGTKPPTSPRGTQMASTTVKKKFPQHFILKPSLLESLPMVML